VVRISGAGKRRVKLILKNKTLLAEKSRAINIPQPAGNGPELLLDALEVAFGVVDVGVTVEELGVVGSGRVTELLDADGRSSGNVRAFSRDRSMAVWFSRSRDRSAEFVLNAKTPS